MASILKNKLQIQKIDLGKLLSFKEFVGICRDILMLDFLFLTVFFSVAEPHHFYMAPAPSKNFDAVQAAPAPAPTLHTIYQANCLQTNQSYL
jgi:hypothetical protein